VHLRHPQELSGTRDFPDNDRAENFPGKRTKKCQTELLISSRIENSMELEFSIGEEKIEMKFLPQNKFHLQ
jgi:hypothetical protein